MTKVLPDEITLPKSATMPSLLKLEEELAQAADGLPMFPEGRSHWFEAMNGCETLSVSVARRFTIAEAIALNDFLNKLEASN